MEKVLSILFDLKIGMLSWPFYHLQLVCLNVYADRSPAALMDYFAYQLFDLLRLPNLTAQERGNTIFKLNALYWTTDTWLN